MLKIGITEAGDAGLDFSWVSKLQPVNVIISKQLTSKNTTFIRNLLDNKERIILHVTCTGYGQTVIEPHVPSVSDVYSGVRQLIDSGFPVKQIVLRTDPIIPTQKGMITVRNVWQKFSDIGIERCRYSVIDMYPHVKERFRKAFGRAPFETFQAPNDMINAVRHAVEENLYGYSFECCAENLPGKRGCISKKDFDILGVPFDQEDGGFQRKGCLCCAGKTELLSHKHQCPSGCLYCYWKN